MDDLTTTDITETTTTDTGSDTTDTSGDTAADTSDENIESLFDDDSDGTPNEIPEDTESELSEEDSDENIESLFDDDSDNTPNEIPEDTESELSKEDSDDDIESLFDDDDNVPSEIPEDIKDDFSEDESDSPDDTDPESTLEKAEDVPSDEISDESRDGDEIADETDTERDVSAETKDEGADAAPDSEAEDTSADNDGSDTADEFDKKLDDIMNSDLSAENKKRVLNDLKDELQKEKSPHTDTSDDSSRDEFAKDTYPPDAAADAGGESSDDGSYPVRVLKKGGDTSTTYHDYEEELSDLSTGIENWQKLQADIARGLNEDDERIKSDTSISDEEKQRALYDNELKRQNFKEQYDREYNELQDEWNSLSEKAGAQKQPYSDTPYGAEQNESDSSNAAHTDLYASASDTAAHAELCEEFSDTAPDGRELATYEAFKNAPREIVEELNSRADDLKPVADSGYELNEDGELVKKGCYYSPDNSQVCMNKDMDADEYAEVLPHEMSHFLDNKRGWESSKPEFVNAVQSDLGMYDRSTPEGRMRFNQMLDDAVNTGAADDRAVSDFLFGIFGENGNDQEILNRFEKEGIAAFNHSDAYWMGIQNDGTRAPDGGASIRRAEIYAEVGAVRCHDRKKPLHFLERNFPAVSSQYDKFYNINKE